MLVDIHTHRKENSNYLSILSIDFSETGNEFTVEEGRFYSVGFHPWNTDKYRPDRFLEMEKFATNNCVLAIGECGLDKNTDTDLNQQIALFEKHITLSESLKKPLIIHCVGRFNELITLKKSTQPTQPWIVHGFRGKLQLAIQLLNSDFNLSFGEHFNPESVNLTPIENLFVESDESQLPIEEIYFRLSQVKHCKTDNLNAGNLLFRNI